MKHVGFGQAVIGKLKETKIKQNLYYEIKDTLVEEQVSNGQIVRKNKLTKVYIILLIIILKIFNLIILDILKISNLSRLD